MPDAPRMHLFIAGLGRAGTTLLANLLTSPPNRWLLVEPGITRSDMGEHVRQQAAQFGLHYSAEEWSAQPGEDSVQRFERLLAGPVAKLQRWGVKEVNPAGWDVLLSRYQPERVAFMVRNLRDAGISVLEKEERNPGVRKTPEWLFERLASAARALVQLHDSLPPARRIVVRYEDFVVSESSRAAVAAALDWPLDGDPGQRLELYGRTYEKERHAGQVTSGSVGRASRELSPEKRAFADRLSGENEAFSRLFGYT